MNNKHICTTSICYVTGDLTPKANRPWLRFASHLQIVQVLKISGAVSPVSHSSTWLNARNKTLNKRIHWFSNKLLEDTVTNRTCQVLDNTLPNPFQRNPKWKNSSRSGGQHTPRLYRTWMFLTMPGTGPHVKPDESTWYPHNLSLNLQDTF
jgi:hypothetical protein